jgi:diguanylate cyclase
MRYLHKIDESRQYLRLALEQIGRHGLPTDPLNYCIWYEYASGNNRELNAVIDDHFNNGNVFTEAFIQQLYHQYIANGRERVTTLVREELKKVFIEIIGAIRTTKQHFSRSETNLETINEALVPSLSEADVEKIVSQIKHEIRTLESSSVSFREQLQQATHEIDRLKSKMARYRNEAITDPLTRIANRRGFEGKLNKALGKSNATSTGTPPCLIIADIDHFKKINDTHGHLVGDNVLRMVAATINESIKGKDLCARIGGEEFAILLPETPFEGALKLAENMRLTFERLDLKKKNTGESLGRLTLSFGVAAYKRGESAEDFMHRADDALYNAKKMGRNKVNGL